MIWYLDTSVLLRAMLDGSAAALSWLNDALMRGDMLISSTMLTIEAKRGVHNRYRQTTRGLSTDDRPLGDLPDWTETDRWLSRITRIDLTPEIASDATLLAANVGTLDGIHIATACAIAVTDVLTHDAGMADAILSLHNHRVHRRNLHAFDPVTDDANRRPVAPHPNTTSLPGMA